MAMSGNILPENVSADKKALFFEEPGGKVFSAFAVAFRKMPEEKIP